MIQFHRKRISFLAAGLAVALGYMPVMGQDKTPTTPTTPRTTTSANAKQVTMTGKVVDLHEFMTGERSQYRSPVDSTPNDRDNANDRPTTPGIRPTPGTTPGSDTKTPGSDTKRPDSDTRLPGSDTRTTDRDDQANKTYPDNQKSQIMGLQTSTGLVLLCFHDDMRSGHDDGRIGSPARPGDQTRPRPGDQTRPAPGTPGTPRTPGTDANDANRIDRSDKLSMKDGSAWVGKQVSVTGTMYEKQGIKYLLVSKITSSQSSSPSTEDRATTLPRPQ